MAPMGTSQFWGPKYKNTISVKRQNGNIFIKHFQYFFLKTRPNKGELLFDLLYFFFTTTKLRTKIYKKKIRAINLFTL